MIFTRPEWSVYRPCTPYTVRVPLTFLSDSTGTQLVFPDNNPTRQRRLVSRHLANCTRPYTSVSHTLSSSLPFSLYICIRALRTMLSLAWGGGTLEETYIKIFKCKARWTVIRMIFGLFVELCDWFRVKFRNFLRNFTPDWNDFVSKVFDLKRIKEVKGLNFEIYLEFGNRQTKRGIFELSEIEII